MTSSPEQTPPAGKSQASCAPSCLVSCLVVTLVLLVVVGVGAYATRAYLVSKLPEWQARFPWLDTAAELARWAQRTPAEGGPAVIRMQRVDGKDEKALLPQDIPTYPEPLDEAYSITESQVTVFQSTSAPADVLSAYFQQTMTERGWTYEGDYELGRGALAVWSKPDWICQIEIGQGDGVSQVWMRCSLLAELPEQ